MAATKQDILMFFKMKEIFAEDPDTATHMLVVCDTFDHEDAPVFIPKTYDGELVTDPREAMDRENAQPMQKVMECYALHLDLADQLAETRAWHFEMPA